MSGLEVIALAFGVFPVVISALEHYKDLHKATALLFRFENEYRKTLDDVKDEQVFFRLVLEQLLLPFCADDKYGEDELEKLLVDTDGDALDRHQVLEGVKARLGRTYERFIEISTGLHSAISRLLVTLVSDKPTLQAKLKAQHDTNHASASRKLSATALRSFLKRQWQHRKEQLDFGLGKPQREELLKQIRRDIEKLEKLLDKSEKIASIRTSKTVAISPRAVKSLLQYWHHADQIYALVRQSWECTCRENHCAHLWLQHRSSRSFEIKFLVLWAPNTHAKQQLPPWDRQGLRVTLSSAEPLSIESGASVRPSAAATSTASSSSQPPGHGDEARRKKRRVGFVDVRIFRQSPSITTQPPIPRPSVSRQYQIARATTTQPPQSIDISQLCKAMSQCGMQAALLGSLSCPNEGGSYAVHSDPDQKITGEGVSLRDILSSGSKLRPKRSDRFEIALAVASSHLQLHSTPWARRQWEASDILFPKSSLSGSGVMYDKPYVSADFRDTATVLETTAKKTDRSFACLGIMLLELLFGACLDAHELWLRPGFDGNQDTPLLRMMVAKEWADQVEDETGPEYSAAVMWCLRESPTTLDGNQWRSDLAHRVVLPLQKCCEWIGARKPA